MAVTRTKLVRINPDLLEQIDFATSILKERNIAKYKSIPDFVEEACLELLKKEKVTVK